VDGPPRSGWQWLRRFSVFLSTELILIALAIAAVATAFSFLRLLFARTQFWILAALPGIIGILYYFVHTLPRYLSRNEALTERYEMSNRLTSSAGEVQKERRETWPSFGSYLWSSLILTAILGVPAVLASIRNDAAIVGNIGGFGLKGNGLEGIIYAGLGAYVALTTRMIARINNNALSSRFLLTASLRISMAMLIGLAAGEFDLFAVVDKDGPRQGLYFLAGMFLNWAVQSLRRRARGLFQVSEDGCEILPLCLVDGLDEQTIDYLEEMGIWDIQHLATADPAELTERTLYPLNRVLDWIDQAILIAYVRGKIAGAREVAVRGAIDFAVTYGWSLLPETDAMGQAARTTLDALAQKVNVTREAITLLGNSCANDAMVRRLYVLWLQRPPEEILNMQSGGGRAAPVV